MAAAAIILSGREIIQLRLIITGKTTTTKSLWDRFTANIA
jgi:hypothetical protein